MADENIISIEEYLRNKYHKKNDKANKNTKDDKNDKTLMLNLSMQEILNIFYALDLFNKTSVRDEYKHIIQEEMDNIVAQLNLQNLAIMTNHNTSSVGVGDKVEFEDSIGYVIGMGKERGWIKVVIGEVDEMPMQLVHKIDDDGPDEAA